MKIPRISAIVLIFVFAQIQSVAQNSAVDWTTITSGGGTSAASNSRVISSVGRATAGTQTAGNTVVRSGFLSFLSPQEALYYYNVTAAWNLISVPLTVDDYARTAVYPTSISNAFYFDAGYFSSATLENGTGYWLKFGADQTISMAGEPRTLDTIDVIAGWNMIGTLSSPIPATSVGSVPGGIVASNFFRFTTMYESSTTLEPGKGYWVKVSSPGRLVMSANSLQPATLIRIEDQGEIPPVTPPR